MNADESITDRGPHPLMAALAGGLPITLLVDLVDPFGPRSREILERESPNADAEIRPANRTATARTA